jgi:hypothetical protein
MIKLVKEHHNDLVSTTHIHLAQQCELEGNHKAAEKHYIEGGEWKLAVKMYRTLDMWEEAFRVRLYSQLYFIADKIHEL